MPKVKVFWLRVRWIVLAVISAVVALLFLFWSPFEKKVSRGGGEPKLPVLPDALQQKLDQVHEEAIAAQAAATAVATKDKEELDEIGKIENAAERRARLAAKLRSMR